MNLLHIFGGHKIQFAFMDMNLVHKRKCVGFADVMKMTLNSGGFLTYLTVHPFLHDFCVFLIFCDIFFFISLIYFLVALLCLFIQII